MTAKLIEATMEAALVPGPAEYAVLVPDAPGPLPLLLFLHGGGGSRAFLTSQRGLFEDAWSRGLLPPMVVATPSAARSFYMDYRDGSQRWESFICGPFLDHLRATYGVARDRAGTFVAGISMGGMGGLRMSFKRPDFFRAVVALEPGIDPAFEWKDVPKKARFWRSPQLMESIFGRPFDDAYWAANNPATIARNEAARLRESGLDIYIEAGDEDFFNLHEATEFLHRVLWDNDIKHEYHLVRGANHVGATVRGRFLEGFEFVDRILRPPAPDPAVTALEQRQGTLKARFGE